VFIYFFFQKKGTTIIYQNQLNATNAGSKMLLLIQLVSMTSQHSFSTFEKGPEQRNDSVAIKVIRYLQTWLFLARTAWQSEEWESLTPGQGGRSGKVFSLFPIRSDQKKYAVWLPRLQAAHLCLSVWVFRILLLSNFTRECIDPASSQLPALAVRTNTARLTQDQVMRWKAMVQKRLLRSYLFYIFKCFVVFGLRFLDF